MNPGVMELRWAYVGLALLLAIDFLVALLVTGPTRLLLLGLLLLLQLLVVWIMQRLISIVRTYRQLKESYEQELSFTQQIMDSTEQGMVVLDAQGRFVYANRAAAELLGRQPQDLLGHEPTEFLTPEDQVLFQQQLKARWTGQQSTYRLNVQHKAGHAVPVQVRGTPRWHHGRIVGNLATITVLEAAPDVEIPSEDLTKAPGRIL